MHLRVFLFANHDKLRSRRIGDIRCSKSWELHRLHTVMTFGDATHSKGDPQHCTLDFHKSPSVGENGESLTKRPSWLKRKNDVSPTSLKKYYNKKRESSRAQGARSFMNNQHLHPTISQKGIYILTICRKREGRRQVKNKSIICDGTTTLHHSQFNHKLWEMVQLIKV